MDPERVLLLVDRSCLLDEGCKQCSQTNDMLVVGGDADSTEASRAVSRNNPPELAIYELRIIEDAQPGMEPMQAFQRRFPNAKLMVLTNHSISETTVPMTSIEEIRLPEVPTASTRLLSSLNSDQANDSRASTEPAEGGCPVPQVETLVIRAEARHQLIPAAIVDKSALFRAGLMHVLAKSRFRVAAECSKVSDLPELASDDAHCVALIGLDQDAEDILREIAMLKERYRDLHVIVLSEQLHPELLLAAVESGADGFLLKNEISADGLLKSLELVLVEGVVVPQGFTKMLNNRVLLQSQRTTAPIVQSPELMSEAIHPDAISSIVQADHRGRLSTREQLILTHLTQGASNKYIARELNIAEATVKVHVKSLLRKIRVNNRTQAAMWAISHGPQAGRQELRQLDMPPADDPRIASGSDHNCVGKREEAIVGRRQQALNTTAG